MIAWHRKSFRLLVLGLQVAAGEFFNAFNVANLTYSATPTLNSAAFGQPTGRVGQASIFGSGGPRAVQVGGRISF